MCGLTSAKIFNQADRGAASAGVEAVQGSRREQPLHAEPYWQLGSPCNAHSKLQIVVQAWPTTGHVVLTVRADRQAASTTSTETPSDTKPCTSGGLTCRRVAFGEG